MTVSLGIFPLQHVIKKQRGEEIMPRLKYGGRLIVLDPHQHNVMGRSPAGQLILRAGWGCTHHSVSGRSLPLVTSTISLGMLPDML